MISGDTMRVIIKYTKRPRNSIFFSFKQIAFLLPRIVELLASSGHKEERFLHCHNKNKVSSEEIQNIRLIITHYKSVNLHVIPLPNQVVFSEKLL